MNNKLVTTDIDALTDSELLTILLSTRRKNSHDLAHALLQQHGLHSIFTRSYPELSQHTALNITQYAQLQASAELHRRYLQEPLKRKGIRHSKDATEFLIAQLRGCEHEVFACLFLDNQHRTIRFETLFHGTINQATIYPRQVVKRALHHNAAAVIAAHNHPSGIAQPSQADLDITTCLKEALALVDVRLLDHFIIAETKAISLSA